jgi:uncharacterized protein YwqG
MTTRRTRVDLTDEQGAHVRELYDKFQREHASATRSCVRLHWEPLTAATASAGKARPGQPKSSKQTSNAVAAAASRGGAAEEYVDDIFCSKLGGNPFWPRSKPTRNDEGLDLDSLGLLAQFNLSELEPESLAARHLPSDGGILQFFCGKTGSTYGLYDHEGAPGSVGYHVEYHPRSVVDQTQDLLFYPDDLASINDKELFPLTRSKPQRLHFGPLSQDRMGLRDARFTELFPDYVLQHETVGIAAALADDDSSGAIREKWRVFEPLYECEKPIKDEGVGSKLGGAATFTQEDPRRVDAGAAAAAPTERQGLQNNRPELLFQLDSEKEVCIGDAGVMHFFLAAHSLQRQEFRSVVYNWDCG